MSSPLADQTDNQRTTIPEEITTNNSATANITIANGCPPLSEDVKLTHTVSPASVNPGQTIIYTVQYCNDNLTQAYTNGALKYDYDQSKLALNSIG